MSIKAMTWAWAQDIEARDKLVLMALADHADDDGICWPGIKGVAVKNRISDRAVQRHIQSLHARGKLRVERQYRPDGGYTANLYTLLLSPPGDKLTPPPDTAALVDVASPPGDTGTTTLVNVASPQEPPSEPPKNHQREERNFVKKEVTASQDFREMSEPAISASAQVNPQSTTSEPAIPVGTSLHEPPRREEREKKLPKKRITEVDQEFREVMQARFGPTLSEIDERIDEALAHKAASKYTDQQAYVRGWLRREIERKANSQNGSNPNAVTRRGFTPYQGSAGQTVYHPKPDADGVVRLGR